MTDEAWRIDPRERLLAAIDQTWAYGELAATPEQLVDDYAHQLAEQSAALAQVRALYQSWVHAGPPPLGASMARWWDSRLTELRAALQPDGLQPAPPEHVDWPRLLDGFQALLDAYPADLQEGGPAVRPRPLPTGLVARWRDTVHTARQQLASPDSPREQRARPTHPDGTPYRYHEIKAEGWGYCDGCRMWSTGTPERPHQCAGTYNHAPSADQTTEN